jgi:hypothetical protein
MADRAGLGVYDSTHRHNNKHNSAKYDNDSNFNNDII